MTNGRMAKERSHTRLLTSELAKNAAALKVEGLVTLAEISALTGKKVFSAV